MFGELVLVRNEVRFLRGAASSGIVEKRPLSDSKDTMVRFLCARGLAYRDGGADGEVRLTALGKRIAAEVVETNDPAATRIPSDRLEALASAEAGDIGTRGVRKPISKSV